MATEQELESLIQELQGLFSNRQSFVNPLSGNKELPESTEYQSPLKGSWHNSGGFTPTSATPGHPKGHMGVDMRAPGGTPIYPLSAGIVTHVGSDPKGGNTVNVQHADGVRSYYAHMSTISVHKGDKVSLDSVLGTVGTSGNASSTWPHLHFQVWKDNQLQNPAKFFSIPQYTNVNRAKEQPWLSEEAKEQAQSFNMRDHISQRRMSFSRDVDRLVKAASYYCRILQVPE